MVELKENIIFSYKRPVSIGVYGHPAHETSRYSLLVYHVTLADQEFFDEQNPPNSFEETPNSKVNIEEMDSRIMRKDLLLPMN